MITRLEIKTKNDYLYTGTFDLSDNNKNITVNSIEPIQFNLNEALNSPSDISKTLSIEDLKEICRISKIKATIYPNGNLSFRKLDSSVDELKSCYVFIVTNTKNKYAISIAFDETQPMLYKAQLLDVFLID